MKEHYRDHSHLLTGQGTRTVWPGPVQMFQIHAWLFPLCLVLQSPELPRPLKWPVGGPGGGQGGQEEKPGYFSAVLPLAAL